MVAEAIQLAEGYELEASLATDRWAERDSFLFRAITADMDERAIKQALAVEIVPPLSDRKRRYRREWHPSMDPEWGTIEIRHEGEMDSSKALALAAMLPIAADLLTRLHEQVKDELDAQLTAHVKQKEAELKEAEEEEKRHTDIKEQVQWYVGQQFKLRRKGYKATVFGTIDRVNEYAIYTTSERGVRMSTMISDLTELHIKYEGERRYTKVWPA